MLKSTAVPALFALAFGVGGTAAAETRVYIPPGCSKLPANPAPTEWDLMRCFAPVFLGSVPIARSATSRLASSPREGRWTL